MANSDNKFIHQNPQDAIANLADKLDIIIILLREGLYVNSIDENASLKQQTNPTILS